MIPNYDLITKSGDTTYYLGPALESLTLEDSLPEIAYRASFDLKNVPDEVVIAEGQPAMIRGISFSKQEMSDLLDSGVIWSRLLNRRQTNTYSMTVYDKTIYLKSEDEYLFPAGQTASQRLKQYAKDWNIPISNIPNTKTILTKAVYRSQSIYSMIMSDLRETVKKGGNMYRPRMTINGLELFELGTNETVWQFESTENNSNIEDFNESSSLDDVVTQVKVLGQASDDARSPVLALLKSDTNKYGTIQRIVTDSKITTVSEAKTEGSRALRPLLKSNSFNGIDVNTIRAGDKITVNKLELIIASIVHYCGDPGHMSIQAGTSEWIKREFYWD